MAGIYFERRIKRLKGKNGLFALCFILSITLGCTKKELAAPGNYFEIENINSFVQVLQEYPNGILANRNDKRLRTQIITFQFAENNRVYFCTNDLKPMYTQLKQFPYVSYCTYADEFEPVVSINGKVVFVEDSAVKLRAFEGNEHIRSLYKTSDNPNLKVFYIDTEEIETFGSDGAKIFKLK
ncbi:pyridoxamine 5-phosphate oxidase [Treponema primitia]|uniref:pyridoxamine 5-phosphate oxidase n=1 Tax=Treponema primitia TaxID=88058 RepID=UPI0039803CE0